MASRTLRPRAVSATVVCGLAAALAGCGSSSPGSMSSRLDATTCGTPYTFMVAGQTVLSGSCAGLLPKHPQTINLRLGERFSLVILGNPNGTRAAPVPTPTGSAVVILQVRGRRVRYRAQAAGRSHLTVRSVECPTDPRVSTCAALTVSVRQ